MAPILSGLSGRSRFNTHTSLTTLSSSHRATVKSRLACWLTAESLASRVRLNRYESDDGIFGDVGTCCNYTLERLFFFAVCFMNGAWSFRSERKEFPTIQAITFVEIFGGSEGLVGSIE